ncbi:MAG: LysM peptidoglycan-binding domain-containing protein [Chloroflexi bacterium]|nr:LysM peptidoglycan-binding domain-containing protein [Chloroflexota bacterium]
MFMFKIFHPRILLASIAIVALSASACTREKPASPLPTPTLAAIDIATQAAPTLFSLATPVATAPLLFFTPPAITSATETPSGPPAPPTSQPPVTVITTIVTNTPSAPTIGLITPTANPGTYIVQLGDWLNKIAIQFGVSAQALIAANPGLNPNLIYPGQTLRIPTTSAGISTSTPSAIGATPVPSLPTTYTVQRGDWLYAIARKFNLSVAALQNANPGVNINVLYPGQTINIPSAATASTPNASTKPNSYTIRAGDTLYSIAVRFSTTPYALQIANHLTNQNFIYPGQELIIPK